MDHDVENEGAGASELPQPSDNFALEVCFLLVVCLVVVAAFFEALTYQLVSSRTPFVIMVPLLLLIGLQARRLYAVRQRFRWVEAIRKVVRGRAPMFRKIAVLNLWFVLLLALIQVAGHYAAIAFFLFMLIWYVAKERWVTALVVAAVATLTIYVLFEEFFNIDLYRGLIYRYFAGYRIF
jgi:hypothetical protein